MNDNTERDLRLFAIPDTHGHAKGEHKAYVEERPLPLTARMLFLWFYHACKRGYPRFLMVADHMNYLTFEDPAAVNLVRRALKLAQAGDLYGAAETANVDVAHAAVVSEGLRRGMRYSIGAEVDNDPRSRPDAQNIVDAMRPDGIIRSVHFVPITHPVHGENWNWPFDNPEFSDLFEVVGTEQLWESYVSILVDAIERLPGQIVGHFFVPAVFGHWPDDAKLSAYEDRVLDAAASRQMAVEFNTRFLYRDHTDDEKRRYLEANKRFLRKAKDRGVAIAVGSDAHSPKDQGNAFDIVLDVLDELEINELVFPLSGQLRRVALRVVREPEPEPVPEPVKAAPPPAAAATPAPVASAASAPAREPSEPKPPRKSRPAPKPAPELEPAQAAPVTVEAVPSPNGATETPAASAEPEPAPPPEHVPDPKPVSVAAPKPAKPAKVEAKPAALKEPARKALPDKAIPSKAAAPAKAVAGKAPAKPAPKPVKAAAPAKPAAKVAAAKTAAKKAPVKAAPAKAAPSKPAKKSTPAKPAPKKATRAQTPAKKAAPPGRATAKKAAPAKKAASARGSVKKTGAAKKVAAKAVRKATAAKKSTKKTAAKRR